MQQVFKLEQFCSGLCVIFLLIDQVSFSYHHFVFSSIMGGKRFYLCVIKFTTAKAADGERASCQLTP